MIFPTKPPLPLSISQYELLFNTLTAAVPNIEYKKTKKIFVIKLFNFFL